MKRKSIVLNGSIGTDSKFRFSNKAEFELFCQQWANSKVRMSFEVCLEEGSDLIIGYYNNKIVPDFQNIFREFDGERNTLEETCLKLRKMAPVMLVEIPKEETRGFALQRVKTVYECSNYELIEFIETLRFIASSNYDYFIEDPKKQ